MSAALGPSVGVVKPDVDQRVQIQILLYFLLLSLPGPQPPPPGSSPKKHTRKHLRQPAVSPPSLQDTVEGFMDKLSTWQLISALEKNKTENKDELDWMQQFSLEVINPQ